MEPIQASETEAERLNFVFLSPNFPDSYRMFCVRLRENGVNVLGVGDAPYDSLHPELRQVLTEYYAVGSLEDYDQVLRALGYFTFRYGKIDWVESNNEHWLELDARLRTDFNISTGPGSGQIGKYRSKSLMKRYFQRAGVPSSRCLPVTSLEGAQAFIAQVGWPVIVKPDRGVGAANTYRLENQAQLKEFFRRPPPVPYLMEEYVRGEVTTYDGVCNSQGEVLFAASHITPNSIVDMANEGAPCFYYVDKQVPADVAQAGRAVLAAFEVCSRCFHLEFFRLAEDRPGLGRKGELAALEVNMRPAGGYTSDMIDFGQSVDLYQIWADMVAFDQCRHSYTGPRTYCVYAGRRDGAAYALSGPELLQRTGAHLRLYTRMPDVMAGLMGNQVAIACFDTKREVRQFIRDALRLKGQRSFPAHL